MSDRYDDKVVADSFKFNGDREIVRIECILLPRVLTSLLHRSSHSRTTSLWRTAVVYRSLLGIRSDRASSSNGVDNDVICNGIHSATVHHSQDYQVYYSVCFLDCFGPIFHL